MKNIIKNAKAYPVVAVFFIFLMGYAILDGLWPKRAASELENRDLSQYPVMTLSGVMSNSWMSAYETYVKDQFALRDQWIDLKSRSESMLLKTENNDILLGKDGYLFSKEFTFNDKRFDLNVTALQRWAERHPQKIDVMIVPSASNILQSNLPFAAPMIDEDAYFTTISDALQDLAVFYDTRALFSQHQQEDIYYRTDHHWTTYGAYLAYAEYAASKGKSVFNLQDASVETVPNFYGTSYSSARSYNAKPDTLTYYPLPNEMEVSQTNLDGTITQTTHGLYNTEMLAKRDKYAAFLYGNNGFSTITGNGEGRILVVKDSYANCFIPFLTASYETIDVVDYRANTTKIDALMAQGNYDNVLFLYSFHGFSEDSYFATRVASA